MPAWMTHPDGPGGLQESGNGGGGGAGAREGRRYGVHHDMWYLFESRVTHAREVREDGCCCVRSLLASVFFYDKL